jgi:alkylation response protein AidB-like acyl-CoA dehydrogenase
VAAAINLAPQIRAARDELEEIRRVPPSLVQALADAGLLQLHLPRSMGGLELPPLTAFRAIEELSKIDGSWGGVP